MKFRSASLRLGGMFVSPLEGHFSPAKTALADRLQWARSSIRKKLDMGGQQETPQSTTPKRNEVQVQDENIEVKSQELAIPVERKPPSVCNGSGLDRIDKKDCACEDPHLTNGEVKDIAKNSQPDDKNSGSNSNGCGLRESNLVQFPASYADSSNKRLQLSLETGCLESSLGLQV